MMKALFNKVIDIVLSPLALNMEFQKKVGDQK